MKNALFFLLLPVWLFAQGGKPATISASKSINPLPAFAEATAGKAVTRAVVVGISNYQDKDIPHLQYANRDAIAFADWLKSPAGGSVPADNIRLLTDEKATNNAVIMALYALTEESKENDHIIIYFSGHGDVDSRIISKDGYLLTYDTPASVYMGLALELDNLQKIVSTLSTTQRASVLVIADACHAGKLAGSSISGPQITSQNLAKIFAGEMKILSCQSNEYSMEGEQWGHGRGVFSWFLLMGITGFADKNGDGAVTLNEIDRFLGDVVPPETAQQQTPITVGDRNATIAFVDPLAFQHLMEAEQAADLKKITLKGIEDDVLTKADSATRNQYQAFKNAIVAGDLIESGKSGQSAWELFKELSANAQLEPLQGLMRHNFAVALLDEVQQALNALMTDDPYEINQWRGQATKYAHYDELVQHAIELLGTEHPLYHSLEAKRLFFEAYRISHYNYGDSNSQAQDSIRQLARMPLYQALHHDTLAPYLYYLLGNSYLGTFQDDSLTYYYHKAMELAPAWILPYLEIGWEYLDRDNEKAGKYIKHAVALQPHSYHALEMQAWWHQRYHQVDSIQVLCKQLRSIHPDLPNDYRARAVTEERITRNYEKALDFWQKAGSKDSTLWYWPYTLFLARHNEEGLRQIIKAKAGSDISDTIGPLALYYFRKQDWRIADSLCLMQLRNFRTGWNEGDLLAMLGKIQVQIGSLDSAAILFQSSIDHLHDITSLQPMCIAWLGVIAQKQGQAAKAESYFQQAIHFHPELWTWGVQQQGAEAYALYGDFLAEQHRFPEAEEKYSKSIQLDTGNFIGYYALARFRARQGKQSAALDELEKALDRYYPNPEPIFQEPLFKKIRKTKRFKTLIDKNFPEIKTKKDHQ